MTEKEDGVETAVEDGTVLWYLDGLLHRDHGPAVIGSHGDKRWYQFGKLHRKDGPAIVRADGSDEWYLNGELWHEGASIVAGQSRESLRDENEASLKQE